MQTMMSPTTFDARFRPPLEVASLRPEMHGSPARPPTNGAVNEEFWMRFPAELVVAHQRVLSPIECRVNTRPPGRPGGRKIENLLKRSPER